MSEPSSRRLVLTTAALPLASRLIAVILARYTCAEALLLMILGRIGKRSKWSIYSLIRHHLGRVTVM